MKEAFISILILGVIVGTVILFMASRELKKRSHEPK